MVGKLSQQNGGIIVSRTRGLSFILAAYRFQVHPFTKGSYSENTFSPYLD
jgi:hypothetical protein